MRAAALFLAIITLALAQNPQQQDVSRPSLPDAAGQPASNQPRLTRQDSLDLTPSSAFHDAPLGPEPQPKDVQHSSPAGSTRSPWDIRINDHAPSPESGVMTIVSAQQPAAKNPPTPPVAAPTVGESTSGKPPSGEAAAGQLVAQGPKENPQRSLVLGNLHDPTPQSLPVAMQDKSNSRFTSAMNVDTSRGIKAEAVAKQPKELLPHSMSVNSGIDAINKGHPSAPILQQANTIKPMESVRLAKTPAWRRPGFGRTAGIVSLVGLGSAAVVGGSMIWHHRHEKAQEASVGTPPIAPVATNAVNDSPNSVAI